MLARNPSHMTTSRTTPEFAPTLVKESRSELLAQSTAAFAHEYIPNDGRAGERTLHLKASTEVHDETVQVQIPLKDMLLGPDANIFQRSHVLEQFHRATPGLKSREAKPLRV